MRWANTDSVGPLSTTLPPYITIMRATFCAITPRSCEIRIRAMPRSATSSLMRSRICRWMVTSRAVVGSSAISRSGPQASAMAMVMRCRWPPENWCGIGVDAARRVRNADAVQQREGLLAGLRRGQAAVQPQRFGHLPADAVHRVERGHRLLEDHADAVAADAAHVAVALADELLALEADAAADFGVFRQQAHERHHGHRLAAAGFADQAEGRAGFERKAHVAHRIGRAAMGLQPHVQVVDFEQRHFISSSPGADRTGRAGRRPAG